jgi:hypothetical protein
VTKPEENKVRYAYDERDLVYTRTRGYSYHSQHIAVRVQISQLVDPMGEHFGTLSAVTTFKRWSLFSGVTA